VLIPFYVILVFHYDINFKNHLLATVLPFVHWVTKSHYLTW